MDLIRIYEINVFKYTIISAVSIDEAVSHFIRTNRGNVRDVRFGFDFIKEYTTLYSFDSPAHRYYVDQIQEKEKIPCTVIESPNYYY